MKSFNKTLIPFLALLLSISLPLSAQQEQSKEDQKVIIITKTIDDDGNEVVKKIIKKGDEASEYLDNNQIIIDADNPDIIDVRVLKDCKKDQFDLDLGDGNNFHFDFDFDFDENDGQKRIHIKGVDENGEPFNVEWEGEGEIPAEIQERMQGQTKHWMHHGGKSHGFLGVVMGKKVENINGEETTTGESPLGVIISSVVEGSGAEAAGLLAKDIITSINGQPLSSMDQLSEEIRKHKAGDEISISYLRDGQAKETLATLQGRHGGRSHHFEWNNDWEEDFGDNFHFKGNHFDFRPAPCRPFIGVYLDLGDHNSNGIAVQRVIPNTPADEVQLQEGDLITAIDAKAVNSHGELVVERDKHSPGDQFTLTYLRDGVSKTVSATFPACDESRTRGSNKVIIIQKSGNQKDAVDESGDAAPKQADPFTVPESNLTLNNFRAFPNPTEGLTTVRFEAEAGPAVITVNDISGKEVYREELNNFDGIYNRQLDLSDAAAGTLLLSIRQGDRIFTDKIILRKDN